jgi:hypothetical protein
MDRDGFPEIKSPDLFGPAAFLANHGILLKIPAWACRSTDSLFFFVRASVYSEGLRSYRVPVPAPTLVVRIVAENQLLKFSAIAHLLPTNWWASARMTSDETGHRLLFLATKPDEIG